ncbi:hypothetical protein CFC21_025309 [Triticum aestivum]|uniref:Uncharacterized protein n=3 Tax=Triticum TaxID=4564 RepID=A0A9R1PXR2_TRITD|nr:uncharacterized protein LOC123046641 [Triticum aestivum]KAF7010948.1 hypothetical protein CFC21_025309 [Triticum aestivum]VAH51665.1 unnamed protein product [Triticum turgidum subsp. durum]
MERKEVMDLGSGEPKEIMDLISGKPMETIGLGSGKVEDYPSVRRLRNRRLLLYLRLQGFDTAYDSVVRESGVQMSKLHLRQLLIWGRWSEALNYIRRFLPPASKDRGREARSLLFFLNMLWALDNVAACSKSGLVSDSAHRDLRFLTSLCSRSAKLPSILRYTLQPPQFRESLDWMLVREKASLIVEAWALDTPELRRNLQLPAGPGLPRDVLPIGPSRPRRHRRERYRRAKASTIAKSYLNRKRSLLSSSPPPGLLDDALNWMADLIEGCLKAGKIPELHQELPLQSNGNEGASGSPLLQTMFSTVTNPSKNPGISSVTNAGVPSCTGRPKCTWCSSVAFSGGAISQPFRTPWITSASNAGPIKHSVGRKRNSGEVLVTAEEDNPDRKRQLTELELVTEVEAGSCSANLMAN